MNNDGEVVFEQEMTYFSYWVDLVAPYLFGNFKAHLFVEFWNRFQDDLEA